MKFSWDDKPSVSDFRWDFESSRCHIHSKSRSGSATRTVKVSGGSGGGGSVPANVKLRSAGERTVQMEDYKDNDWADLIVTSSAGRFFDIKATNSSLELVNHYLQLQLEREME